MDSGRADFDRGRQRVSGAHALLERRVFTQRWLPPNRTDPSKYRVQDLQLPPEERSLVARNVPGPGARSSLCATLLLSTKQLEDLRVRSSQVARNLYGSKLRCSAIHQLVDVIDGHGRLRRVRRSDL